VHNTTLAIAASLIFATTLVNAQTAAPSRAEVKAETLKARQAGDIPSGEQASKETPFQPTQTRAERKAKTLDAVAKGEVTSRGEATAPQKEAKITKNSGNSRADVKAEARAANEAGTTRVGESFPDKTK
jgi:hypothetical protein